MRIGKWMIAIDITPEKRKTKIYKINNNDNEFLGIISWGTGFRKYCFYPNNDTMYSADCLEDIIKFIEKLERERKDDKNESFLCSSCN